MAEPLVIVGNGMAAMRLVEELSVRALDRDRALNAGFDRVGRAITVENKWHAQRYGVAAIDEQQIMSIEEKPKTAFQSVSSSPMAAKPWSATTSRRISATPRG